MSESKTLTQKLSTIETKKTQKLVKGHRFL